MKGNKTLADLKEGEKGKITLLNDYELSLKLMDMGCIPGSDVKISCKAPFGGPISFCVCGYKLSLRKEEAKTIVID